MARNPNVAKLRKQKFRRRRGVFARHSVETSLDTDVNPSLRQFWSQRISTPSRVSPGGVRLFAGNANIRPDQSWLDTVFPGVRMRSIERRAAEELEAKIKELMEQDSDPTHNFVLDRTRNTILRLYFNLQHNAWWFVFTHHITNCAVIKTSIRYSSKERALACRQTDTIRWFKERALTFPNNSS